MAYEIGKFRGRHTLWMTDDNSYKNSSTDDMYVNSHDYSVWYKGRQVGYMTHDKTRINPFNERVYKDLKRVMPDPVARVRENKEVPAAKLIPTSSLLDAENEVEAMLKSVNGYCGATVLGDEVFAELAKELEVLIG